MVGVSGCAASKTRADAESKKLSSVEADVDAWLERVSPAIGPCASAFAMVCLVSGSPRANATERISKQTKL